MVNTLCTALALGAFHTVLPAPLHDALLTLPFSNYDVVRSAHTFSMRPVSSIYLEDEAPPKRWITHEDEAVLRAVAVAVGHDALVAKVDDAEGEGQLMLAARYSRIATRLGDLGRLSDQIWSDLLYRTTDLLELISEEERANDSTIKSFELEALGTACLLETRISCIC